MASKIGDSPHSAKLRVGRRRDGNESGNFHQQPNGLNFNRFNRSGSQEIIHLQDSYIGSAYSSNAWLRFYRNLQSVASTSQILLDESLPGTSLLSPMSFNFGPTFSHIRVSHTDRESVSGSFLEELNLLILD